MQEESRDRGRSAFTRSWLIVLAGYGVVLALIWIDELCDLPHALLGAPASTYSWQDAMLHSGVVTFVAVLAAIAQLGIDRGRRRADEERRRLADRLRLLAEQTWDWVFWVDADGKFIYASPSCERITGHASGRFLADPGFLVSIIHPDDRVAFEDHRRSAHVTKKPGETRFRIVRPDGEVRWVGHVCRPIHDEEGNFLGIQGANRDITAQQEAEAALETSEAHLRRAQEVARVGSWDLDLETGVLYWSDEVYRLFGVKGGTPLDYETFMETVLPEDRELVGRRWRQALKGGDYDVEHRIVVGDEVKWVREKAEVDFGEDGRARRGVGIVQDITARKSAEEEATQLEAELAHVTRVSTLGEFSAALAHELNQPLAAILANAQAALRFMAADEPDLDELREILGDIADDDKRARDIILKLRELTRKPASRQKPAPIEVNPLIESVLKIVRGDLALRRVTACAELAPDVPRVSANAIQLQQALLNLVLNALEAMQESPARRLGIESGTGEDGAVEIAVEDTGSGVDPAMADRIFEPFNTTKEQGMGMGLAISRAIAVAHGGSIRLEPGSSGGARFVISLPAVREKA